MRLIQPNQAIILALAVCISSVAATAHPNKNKDQLQPSGTNLSFIENRGQVTDQYRNSRSDIDFKLGASGINIFFGDGQLHYQWSKSESPKRRLAGVVVDPNQSIDATEEAEVKIEAYRMDVVLVGANKNAEVIRAEKQSYQEHYYLPQYKGAVSAFNKITYKNIYHNIDWVLYTQDNQLKYDFVVHPGGNPSDIKLQYKGATTLKLKEGSLVASTPFGSVTEQKPYTYDAVTKQQISSSFVLSENILSFNITASSTHDIVIDPVLEWATYAGGSLTDYGLDVTANDIGDAYLTGHTNSSDVATVGAHQTAFAGNWDAYIVKFNTFCVRQWATYFGGTSTEYFTSAACDPSGNLYVSGSTYSAGLASAGAHQAVLMGTSDAMLAKFSSNGILQWATYFGGTGSEDANVGCDASGNVYIVGGTSSTGNISTPGAHQSTFAGSSDAFVAKFSSAGVQQWGSYLGGSSIDLGRGIDFDASGDVIVCGNTTSSTGIATPGAHQSSINGGFDGFVVKFSSSGARIWGTYYGGPASDYVVKVATGPSGDIYAAGLTSSNSGIATVGSHQPIKGDPFGPDGFLIKFSSAGVQQWGTYYGGLATDNVLAVAVGGNGYIYLMGQTYSSNAIATAGGYQPVLAGNSDMYLAEFTSAGVRNWATYYGGPSTEYVENNGSSSGLAGPQNDGLAISSTGKLYFSGSTFSTTGIATAGAHQTTGGGSSFTQVDAFLTSWYVDTVVFINQPYIDTVLCQGETFALPYSVSYPFRSGNVFTAQLSDAAGSFASPITIGTAAATSNGNITVTVPRNIPAGTNYRIRIVASQPSRISQDNAKDIRIKLQPNVTAASNSPVCVGDAINLTATSTTGGTNTYLWTGPAAFSTTTQNPTRTSATASMAGDYVVILTDTSTCTALDTVTVVVNTIPAAPVAGSNSPACPNTPLTLTSLSTTPGVIYGWTGPNGFMSALQNPVVSNSASYSMSGIYSVTASKDGCTSPAGTVNVTVAITTPTPVASVNDPICLGNTMNLSVSTIAGATYQWTGPAGFTSNLQNPVITNVQAHEGGRYMVTATINGCVSLPDTIDVNVKVVLIGAYASPNDTICKGFTATFVAFPQLPGIAPSYQWHKNHIPIPGANSLIYATPNLITGDKIYCSMTATGICPTAVTVTTDTFEMVVLPTITVPSVQIYASPGLAVSPTEQVTFTAMVANGGTTPKYQWYKNGVILPGARYATLVTQGLYFGDKISVDVISEDPCAEDTTASDTVVIGHPTGLADRDGAGTVRLYPNPNKGSFTVSGVAAGDVNVEIINAVGQVVYSDQAKQVVGELRVDTQLPQGIYLIRLTNGNNLSQTLKFIVAE